MKQAALLLAGGQSRRMGTPKDALVFGGETLLARVARTLAEAVPLLLVVRSAGQQLAGLPRDIEVAEDSAPHLGPLEGLRAGLTALAGRADAVYLCAVDCPFLQAAFVARMFALLGPHDAVVPRVARRVHPLSGCYRVSVHAAVERLLAAGRRDILALLDEVDTRFAGARALRAADARLDSLVNVNTPEEYHTALLRLGEARA